MNLPEDSSVSIHHTIARYYWHDARDFLARFNVLWEEELHKSGRIKTFVDLLMACECALKSHAMLGGKESDPKILYSELRKAGHKIGKLADLACLSADRTKYDFVKTELQKFSVFIRYSVEAYEEFFPILQDWGTAKINHSNTIGNNQWVLSVRDCTQALVDELTPHFTGFVTMDIGKIFDHEKIMRAFMSKTKSQKNILK
jgi:hypothetical protein